MSQRPTRRNHHADLSPGGAAYMKLPIYVAALDLAVALDHATARFARRHRYNIGEDLRKAALEVLKCIPVANRRETRRAGLDALCAAVELVQLLLNVGKALEAFRSFPEYATLLDEVVNVARQAEGWRRHSAGLARPEHGGEA